jgi:cell wall-associated NlpC family hydrolase
MNHYGICNLSAVALRAEPSSKSELISMLLCGETFQILDAKDGWLRIKTTFDEYEAWLEGKQYDSLYEAQFNAIQQAPLFVSNSIAQEIGEQQYKTNILLGSTLPLYKDGYFEIGHRTYRTNSAQQAVFTSIAAITETALQYLNAPYLWGGRSPFGIDCSGLTQMVFKINGIKLRRDAWMQSEEGSTIDFFEAVQPGDLAFFDNENGKITHVGIVLSDNRIIHASGQVRIDKLDRSGIYNEAAGKYTHKLRIIKRVVAAN